MIKEYSDRYYGYGLQVVPIGLDKIPTVKGWTKSTDRHNFKKSEGIGLVCGFGGIQGFDFDTKYDLTGTLYERYVTLLDDNCPGLINKMLIQKTVSGGYHWIFRCDVIGGNTKYASRNTTDEEREESYSRTYLREIAKETEEDKAKEIAERSRRGDKVRVLIETREDGGYLAIYPTKGYSVIQGGFDLIQTISIEERSIMIDCAKVFNEIYDVVIEKKDVKKAYNDNKSPLEDWNERGDVLEFLYSHGWTLARQTGAKHLLLRPGGTQKWSADYDTEMRLFYVWTESTDFDKQKAYNPSQVLAIIQFNGNYSEAAKWLLKQGYGKFEKQNLVLPNGTNVSVAQGDRFSLHKGDTFWNFHIKPRTKEIVISPIYLDLKNWLHAQGYWRYVYAKDKWILIQIKDNIITEVYKKDVKKCVMDYVLGYDYTGTVINGNMVYEEFASREAKIFSDGIFEIIDEKTINWNRDTEKDAYYYFRNKCVVVTSDKYDLIDYCDLPGMVWSTQVIDKDITIIEDYEKNDFCKFIRNVCGKKTDKINSFGTAFGYMLHGYKDCTYLPAVILTDEIVSDDPNGGSGKGIIIKAISNFKKVVEIDGKNFDFGRSFAFQRVNLDTQIIAFQDVQSKFDFEKLFSIITEGISVEKKNKDEFTIPFSESPKIMLTTNYVIKGSGSSHERRKIELELSNYYHSGFSPKDDFGRRLFDGWSDEDWNRFYNYMFDCVRAYLMYGVLESSTGNLPYKKAIAGTSKEFVEWADDAIDSGMEYNKKDLFDDFIGKYGDYHNMKQRTFSTWCERYGFYKGYIVDTRKSNLDRFISFKGEKVKQSELQLN